MLYMKCQYEASNIDFMVSFLTETSVFRKLHALKYFEINLFSMQLRLSNLRVYRTIICINFIYYILGFSILFHCRAY